MLGRALPAATAAALAIALLAPLGGDALGAAKLAPPVIRESFTPLPCSGKSGSRTTLEEEGCYEQQILASDAKINAIARAIFSRLLDDAARRRFILAQKSWFAFRVADCDSRADLYEGGTLASVVDAACSAEDNSQRLKDLRAFHAEQLANN